MSPKVSVILTTHGEGRHLTQAIGSVMAQTMNDWELIIAYDAPSDYWYGTNFVFDDQRIKHHRITVPKEVVNRYAYTINQAFKHTKGDYITYLCHDDLYLPWRLEFMARALDHNNPPVDVLYGSQQLLYEEADGKLLWGQTRNAGATLTEAAQKVDHSSVMHRRECFNKAGGWDEQAPMRYGDAYFWTRLNKAGYLFVPLGGPPGDCHRFNHESVTWKIDHPKAANA